MSRFLIFIVIALITATGSAKQGFGPGEQDWGHINVRGGAHMFYWLYYTTANVANHTQRPLAIWLQGGPGDSSTGFGNFEELGPLDLYLNHRNFTWIKDMNVLFIDNPVGSGFSYTENINQLTTTNLQIALDLVELMKGFYTLHPEFVDVPLHIFCESYGGKMAPEFALELYRAIQRKELRSNLQSVNLGNPWTSPIDSVLSWAPFLLQMGIVDEDGYQNIMAAANKTEQLVNEGKWYQATTQWSNTQSVVLRESKGVDFYNVLKLKSAERYPSRMRESENEMDRILVQYDIEEDRDEILKDLMRGPVSAALNISSNIRWGSQRSVTSKRLKGDFMKPVIHVVDQILDETNLGVSVYSGQLDLICATPGTVNWISKMQWSYKPEYIAAPRVGINVNRVLEGYEKNAGNFTMFWINRAGHMAPADNPAGMDHVLRKITKYNQTN